MTGVLIVEDSKVMREYLERMLILSEEYVPVASIENAANADIFCMSGRVDLVLMDVCTADNSSGLTAAETVRRHYPEIKVIIMTSMPEHSFLQKAREAGCDSFWYKEEGEMSLMEVCDRTMAGDSVWPAETPEVKIGGAVSSSFTQRELSVIRGLAEGRRYEEIAASLGISVNTVKYHVKNILSKTGYTTTMRLVAEVVEKRLVLPSY